MSRVGQCFQEFGSMNEASRSNKEQEEEEEEKDNNKSKQNFSSSLFKNETADTTTTLVAGSNTGTTNANAAASACNQQTKALVRSCPDDLVGRQAGDFVLPLAASSSSTSSGVSTLKSLLKKSSNSPSDSSQSTKHNRAVSFNQTVIVFCEEIEAPSPIDQYEPPLGYQDSTLADIEAFEPPEDYCDHKALTKAASVTSSSSSSSALNRKYESSLVQVGDENLAFNSRGVDCTDKGLCATNSASFTDDQLFGLLNNESILDTFKLNCDDFSEEDFPINQLNSNHSYLCNDAISDYDSDSESSLDAQRKPLTFNSVGSVPRESSARTENNIINNNNNNSTDIKLVKCNVKTKNSLPSDQQENNCSKINNLVQNSRETEKPVVESTKSLAAKSISQRSLPARMKVSTVDVSHLKRTHLNRKEDSTLQRPKPIDVDRSRAYAKFSPPQSASNPEETVPSLGPILIKQSTVAPIDLSKPIIVTNTNLENSLNEQQAKVLSRNLTVDATIQTQVMAKQSDQQIEKDSNLSRKAESLSHKSHNLNQLHTSSILQATQQNAQSQPVCHICRAIESNRSQADSEAKNVSPRNEQLLPKNVSNNSNNNSNTNGNNNNNFSNSYQPNRPQEQPPPPPPSVTSQPAISNQSCISCREVSLRQQNIAQNGVQPPRTSATNGPPPPRLQTYQLVYVVDQNGNRIRALSLVRPGIRNPTPPGQPVVGQRILIAQNGVRFPNPVSMANQIVNLPTTNHVLVNNSNWNQNLVSSSVNPQQIRLAGQVNHLQQIYHNQQYNQPSNSIMGQKPLPNVHRVPVESLGLRQHTVYYVRQPLDTQNMRQTFESSAGSDVRSFPDPHEIRRLDGLRGPTTTLNLSNRIDQNLNETNMNKSLLEANNIQHHGEMARKELCQVHDENDDPTFGFSKRPSVKVVATSSSQQPNQGLNTRSVQNNMAFIRGNSNQAVNIKPASMILLESQTLDRRHMNQQQQSQAIKENIPSTNSMSNIHGMFTSNPNKVSINTITTSQQQRISTGQIKETTSQDNLRFKESKTKELETVSSETSNRGSTATKSVVTRTSGQNYSLNDQNDTTLEQNRKANNLEKLEVAYSMNI